MIALSCFCIGILNLELVVVHKLSSLNRCYGVYVSLLDAFWWLQLISIDIRCCLNRGVDASWRSGSCEICLFCGGPLDVDLSCPHEGQLD
jgi:hypothetical protein